MSDAESAPQSDGAKAEGSSSVAAAFADEMASLPAQCRVTHIPMLGHRIATTGFLIHDDAYYWLLPTRHVFRVTTDGTRDPFDLAMTLLEPIARKACHTVVIHGCVCRSSFGCENFPQDIGCLFLGEAARGAPREDGRTADVGEGLAHIRKAIAAGLVPTLAWEWDITMWGGRQNEGLAVCFCDYCHCDLRLSAREATARFRRKFKPVPGLVAHISDACKLCGTCSRDEVCCVNAIAQGSERAEIDPSICIRCGRCADVCPEEAISYDLPADADVVAEMMAILDGVTTISGHAAPGGAS
ncbi:MAG: 4Fe-4S binding protein [Actinomycetes bacterium]